MATFCWRPGPIRQRASTPKCGRPEAGDPEPVTGVARRREARASQSGVSTETVQAESGQRPRIGTELRLRPRAVSGHEGATGLYTADDIQTSDRHRLSQARRIAAVADVRRVQYHRSMGDD